MVFCQENAAKPIAMHTQICLLSKKLNIITFNEDEVKRKSENVRFFCCRIYLKKKDVHQKIIANDR